MYYTTAQYAHVLAARLWFREKSLKSIAKDWEVSEQDVKDIQNSEEYLSAIETLMRTTRSPANILKWMDSYGDTISSELSKRFGLPETTLSAMVDRVKRDIHESRNWGAPMVAPGGSGIPYTYPTGNSEDY